jgi:hypothetical protein
LFQREEMEAAGMRLSALQSALASQEKVRHRLGAHMGVQMQIAARNEASGDRLFGATEGWISRQRVHLLAAKGSNILKA